MVVLRRAVGAFMDLQREMGSDVPGVERGCAYAVTGNCIEPLLFRRGKDRRPVNSAAVHHDLSRPEQAIQNPTQLGKLDGAYGRDGILVDSLAG